MIDYGGGNVGSLLAALQRRGAEFVLTGDADVVERADAAILPGDGAFAATIDALRERGLDGAIRAVIAAGAGAGVAVGRGDGDGDGVVTGAAVGAGCEPGGAFCTTGGALPAPPPLHDASAAASNAVPASEPTSRCSLPSR